MKRNIFRLMTLCTVAVLALASCKKDNGNDGNVPEKGFRATVEQIGDNGNNGSRTHINPENWNDGTEWPVLWTEGDQVLVRNNAGQLRLFQLQSGANTNDGIFMPADGEEYDYESGPFCAVYSPEVSQYAEDPEALAQVQELLFSGTTALVSVPTTQVYKANSFAEGAMPMAAYGDGQTLEFKNLAGGLCFPIVSDRAMTISAIRVESLDENDAVSGTFNIDCSHPTSPMTPYSNADGPWTVPSVRLRIREGVTLDADNPVYFTVMVAPGSLERGFTVKAYNENDLLVYEKTVDWSANPHTGFIPRSVIKKVNSNLEIEIIETDFEGLTFEAKTPNATVYFSSDMEPWPSLEYSITGTAWGSYYGEEIVLENVGDKVFFRGNNESFYGMTIVGYNDETGAPIYEYAGSQFSCTADCYVYGNIMSILDKENFATATTVPERAFYALFEGNQNISNHPQKPLVLPATTLNISCYENMFKGCTGLTSAPELPATTLAESCYANMFNNCTGLTAAPELPATTMERFCYSYMFSECTSLTAAPELPATTLAESCYASMFNNCTSLTEAELPATTMVMNCYANMFNNCTGLTSAPELPATTLGFGCYNSMFFGCTGLTTAPVLPATTLADNCYRAMFMNCTSLTTAPVLPAQTLDEAGTCYEKMFSGCTGLTSAPVLPATTLGSSCYSYMFEGCTRLTVAPALPATTLRYECYRSMFEGCTGLTTAPAALPAETLQRGCYMSMFKGCTSLTAAPELPATTLADQCYWSMFENCSNLNYIKCLATDISASYCTRSWVQGVSSTGTFVKHPSMTGWSTGNNGIPSGWTVQDASL